MSPTQLEERLTTTLDEVEERLPTIPAAVLRLERSIAARTIDVAGSAVDGIASTIGKVGHQARTSVRTVAGTARHAADTSYKAARTGFRTVIGQSGAQLHIVADTVGTEIERGHDAVADGLTDLVEAVDPAESDALGYERWTRAELYEKATELDIAGRSAMTKDELLAALRT